MAGSEETGMIKVRQLSGHDEYAEAVNLQKEIWGFDDLELLPVRLFVVAGKVGGHSFGAYDGKRMVGFCLAIPGIKRGQAYLHSHMLGVLQDYRDAGVGRMLKLAQREEALARGINLIEWTFDPLELKNAYFNIQRLGAVVRRYVLNQYGVTTSPLHGSLPTDRCVAEWWIGSARVERALLGELPAPEKVVARIEIPNEIGTLREKDPKRARMIQQEVTGRFLEYFDRGFAVTGFERKEKEGAYLFEIWESE